MAQSQGRWVLIWGSISTTDIGDCAIYSETVVVIPGRSNSTSERGEWRVLVMTHHLHQTGGRYTTPSYLWSSETRPPAKSCPVQKATRASFPAGPCSVSPFLLSGLPCNVPVKITSPKSNPYPPPTQTLDAISVHSSNLLSATSFSSISLSALNTSNPAEPVCPDSPRLNGQNRDAAMDRTGARRFRAPVGQGMGGDGGVLLGQSLQEKLWFKSW